ncbi:MAG: VWA domain-containing protein [SAR324 cluster bacterium]|nr:VWA domain-containing protein [SAR324 cluster bacterium]
MAKQARQKAGKTGNAAKSHIDISIVLDRSGSMASIKDDTIGGFNTFISEQKKVEGEGTLTMVQFDNEFEFVHKALGLQKVPLLDDTTFVPRGSTALLDAIGRTLEYTGARLGKMKKASRPDQVLFVIITDGQENASREFSLEQINRMIGERKEKDLWQFVFIGANQDAIESGAELGIDAGNTHAFAADAQGTQAMFQRVSGSTVAYRESGVAQSAGFFKK